MQANSHKDLDDKAPAPCAFQEPMTAPRHMQDGSTEIAEQLETIDLSKDPSAPRPISISVHLTSEEKKALVSLLKEFRDVFAYEEMPGLNPNLVSHTLNIELGTKLVVQPRRNFHPEIEKQIKVEIEKLLAAGFIKPIKHPTWLANIVPVKKKTRVIRICTDYRDLNQACPKDEFSLPNMDILIDSTSGQGLLSFMDGFSGYNQIKISSKDAEKTAFRTPYGNFYYSVMPFGLKNAGATYQRAMTAVFHDMMGKEVEDYVDDLVVKSKTRESHQEVLRRVLERCRLYGLKTNPKKCAFGVSSGKFLGFQVHQRGIDVDPEKTRAINSLAPPRNPKEFKSFMGRLSYIRRFIPRLAATMSVFTPLLKKGKSYEWSKKCQEAYKQVQQIITKLPTMRAPISGLPLKLYLATTNTAVGALLAQDNHSGEESPIYYRLRHYFLAHKLQLIVKSDPVRYLLTRPVLSGRLARWLLQLSEFDITCTTPKAIKGQAVIDMLALFPEIEESTISKEVLGELPEIVAVITEEEPWTLYFYGSSTSKGGGASVVRINPEGQATTLSSKLNFPCTNNTAEYEAFIMGMSTAREMGVERIKIIGDSNLVLKHIPGVTNRYADALATLGSKLSFVEEQPNIAVIKKDMPRHQGIEGLCDHFRRAVQTPSMRYFDPLHRDNRSTSETPRGNKQLKCKPIVPNVQQYPPPKNHSPSPLRKIEGLRTWHPSSTKFCQPIPNMLDMRTPWPFHTWGLDLIVTIHSPSDGYIWILTATEYFTKWVEAVPLRKATGAAIANFIREYIVCRFGIPYKIVTNNGTPFVNKQVSSTLSGYGVKHHSYTPYYPQGNGQAEATNKTLLRILSKMVHEYEEGWSVHLPDALWAYRISPRSATGFLPYSLVYGSDVISPVEITIPTARVTAVNDLEWGTKVEAKRRTALYHKAVAQAYNRTVRPRAFKQGDHVLKVVEHVRRQVSGPSKFAPQWEGPFAIKRSPQQRLLSLGLCQRRHADGSHQREVAQVLLLLS
ncbi:unnamed protein product [Prunus armeniaca]